MKNRYVQISIISLLLFSCGNKAERVNRPSLDTSTSTQHRLTTFQIKKDQYKGIPVYQLDGGMSAEYAVEKSLENLDAGISHSWVVSAPGSGPNPVYATPQFLEAAVEQTVKLYNDNLGATTPFNTVIISTGIPSVPYTSNVLGAPVLPIHFLASVNTVKEVQSILDYSNLHDLKSYATLGYDLSVVPAVAWIKLLDIPPAYQQFLKQHQVKNVLIMGQSPAPGGETKAKKVLNKDTASYASGSLYILYPGNSSNDEATLTQRISDLKQTPQSPSFTTIADWESGIVPSQVANFRKSITIKSGIPVASLTSIDLLAMYDLATQATIALFKKNHLQPSGVTINPYLISHPGYECWKGFIPLNYWQGNPAENTVSRIYKTIIPACNDAFPVLQFDSLKFWVNSSNNFGGPKAANDLILALRKRQLINIITNDYSEDEIWDPNSGMNAICEKIAVEVSSKKGAQSYNSFQAHLQRLSFTDLISLAKKLPTLEIRVY